MNKQKFDKRFLGKKIAIHCKTEQEAKEFIRLVNSFGYSFPRGTGITYWDKYDETISYTLEYGSLSYCRHSYFIEQNYEIVEYSDLIDKPMSKSDLKSNYLVELRNGRLYLLAYDKDDELLLLSKDDTYGTTESYREDLTHMGFQSLDIMKVYGRPACYQLLKLSTDTRELLWESEPKLELTERQIEILKAYRALGMTHLERVWSELKVSNDTDMIEVTEETEDLFEFIGNGETFDIVGILEGEK
jgi:hypothetical protein